MLRQILTSALACAIAVGTSSADAGENTDKEIVIPAVEADSFNALAAVFEAVRLVETRQGKGPFIVLAPTGRVMDDSAAASHSSTQRQFSLRVVQTDFFRGRGVPAILRRLFSRSSLFNVYGALG